MNKGKSGRNGTTEVGSRQIIPGLLNHGKVAEITYVLVEVTKRLKSKE